MWSAALALARSAGLQDLAIFIFLAAVEIVGGSIVIIVVAERSARPLPSRRIPMQYLLLLYADETGWGKLTPAEQEQGVAAYAAYTAALTKAGVLRGSNRLQPIANATTVRMVDGKSQVLDGPYVDSKEQLGGYYVIDVPDLDAALSWAARCPGAGHGVVEVRPSWVMPG
jgi:hypothetical protein